MEIMDVKCVYVNVYYIIPIFNTYIIVCKHICR